MTFTPQLIDNTAPGESLRSGATKINANFLSIADTVNNLALISECVAGEHISQHQLVYVDSGTYKVATYDSSIAESVAIGIAREDILKDETGLIQFGQSIITDTSWSFSPGEVLYLGSDGEVTNDVSSGHHVVPVGFAVTSSSILLNLQSGFTYSLDAGTI